MQKITDILNEIWKAIRRAYARLLSSLYTSCRETCSHINGQCRLEITSRCQVIEDLCARTGVHIPETALALPTPQERLLRWYMAIRFNWSLRVTIYKGKIIIRYLDIPLKRLMVGNAKDVADSISTWESLINSYIEKPKSVIATPKDIPSTSRHQNKVQFPMPKARRPVNVSSYEPQKTDKEEPETINVVQVNGAIIDNSF